MTRVINNEKISKFHIISSLFIINIINSLFNNKYFFHFKSKYAMYKNSRLFLKLKVEQ
jgi:hypothetical protein